MNSASKNLLKFSVVTPSLNQGEYIEATIKSVLAQEYANFEHFVIDGGSRDKTISILSNYSHLTWISEQDTGQSNAINKGFLRATGDIIAWINSDDWYEPGAFHAVNKYFLEHPQSNIVMGDCFRTNHKGKVKDIIVNRARGHRELRKYWITNSIPTQPAIFFRRKLLVDIGTLDETLHFAMDFDLWLRFAKSHRFHHIEKVLASYRFHSAAKGGTDDWSNFMTEWKQVYQYQISLPIRIYDWPGRQALRIGNKLGFK